MEKVTIVIPNYNGIKYLPGCIEALDPTLQGADVGYEILVVDNGSNDGSLEYLNGRENVRVIPLDTNTGFCHAVNVGIKEAKTPYVLLLNNDTKACPGFVRYLYEAIDRRKKCFSVSAQMLMWDDATKVDDAGDLYCVLGWSQGRGKGRDAVDYDKSCKIFSACGGAAIYRRSIFDEIGLFDEQHFAYLEDLDVGYRAKLFGYYNMYEPRAKVVHFGSATTGSRYNNKKTELSSANNIYVIYKNMPWPQIAFNILPLFFGFVIKALFFAKKGMGRLYLKGLGQGFKKCHTPQGRKAHISLSMKRFAPCLRIQWELWINTFKILKKS